MFSNKFVLMRQPCISQPLSGNDKMSLAIKNHHRILRFKMHLGAVRKEKAAFSVLWYTFFPWQLKTIFKLEGLQMLHPTWSLFSCNFRRKHLLSRFQPEMSLLPIWHGRRFLVLVVEEVSVSSTKNKNGWIQWPYNPISSHFLMVET